MEREKKDDGTIARAAVSEKMQQPMTEQRNPRVSSRRDDYALFLLWKEKKKKNLLHPERLEC